MLALVLLSTMYPEIVLSGQYYQYGDDERQLAQEWQKAGWHYGYVYSWSSAGFRDPKEAMVWVQVTPSARDAAAFKRRGFTPEQAKWLMKKYPPQGYLTFGSFPKIDSYLHAGLTPRAVLSWIAVNITSSDPLIRRYVAMGMQDAELIEWEKQGIRVNEMVLFKNAGVSLSEAKEWQATGLNLNDMILFRNARFSPSEAKEWHTTGLNSNDTVLLKGAGFSPSEATKWHAAGLSVTESAECKKSGLSLNEAHEKQQQRLREEQAELARQEAARKKKEKEEQAELARQEAARKKKEKEEQAELAKKETDRKKKEKEKPRQAPRQASTEDRCKDKVVFNGPWMTMFKTCCDKEGDCYTTSRTVCQGSKWDCGAPR